MAVTRHAVARAADTRERMLHAALRRARQDGAGALSLQSIAAEAQVSKALVLYHFQDKDEIFATVITWLTARVVAREARALAESSAASVLETLWRWLEREITDGELRVLIELTGQRGEQARLALQRSAEARHTAASATVGRVFELLHLSPRVPIMMMAATELAFREGLVLSAAREPERNTRVAFDAFWLSLLSLAQ